MNPKLQDKNIDFLFQAILSLKTTEDCYRFFDDLCTVPELKAMSQRLAVAHMLSQKQVYSDIVAETGASTATISRVNRSLNYGSDGYDLVFSRLDAIPADGSTLDTEIDNLCIRVTEILNHQVESAIVYLKKPEAPAAEELPSGKTLERPAS